MEIGTGMGFEVQITLTTYNFLKEKSEALVYTYLHIKKDGQTFSGYDIFGFSEYEDKILFVLLLDVSGIGANTARLMLNALSHSEIRRAIISEDERTLSGIKGIGPKTAKRLILDVQEKLKQMATHGTGHSTKAAGQSDHSPAYQQALNESLAVLESLGYEAPEIAEALSKLQQQNEATALATFDAEQLLRALLKTL